MIRWVNPFLFQVVPNDTRMISMKFANRFLAGVLVGAILVWPMVAGSFQEGNQSLEFDGVIEPYRIVEVGSEVPGILKKVYVDRGDTISVGQKVALLRSGVEKATLELARVRADMQSNIRAKRTALEFSQRHCNRIKDLYEAKAQSFQKWDEVETQRILAETELADAMEQKRLHELEFVQASEVVKRKTILSPVAGVVMERYLSKGEYVEDKPVIKVAQMDPLKVEVVMLVSEIGFVKIGMRGIVKPEAPVNGEYEGIVTIVDKVIDAASGTFGVRLEIPNPKFKIPPGLKCKVIFSGTSKELKNE